MLDIKILAGVPVPMSYQCVPSSICVALLSGQDLNYLEISSAYLGEDNQSAGRQTRWQSALKHLWLNPNRLHVMQSDVQENK